MGSISSTNSNLSNLLQTLQAESPQLSSILSTPNMQSALENASPGDLVQLSDQALQLQQVGLLFGNPDGTQSTGFTSPDSLFSLLEPQPQTAQTDPLIQALESSLGVAGANGTTTSDSTTSNQLANVASGFQAQELNALFGTPQMVDPFLNTLG